MKRSMNMNDTKTFYIMVKEYIPLEKFKIPDYVFNIDGSLTKSKEETGIRIFQHFNLLLNQESNISNNIVKYLPIQEVKHFSLDDPFSMKEFICALKELKNDKACGEDNIPIEIIKYCDQFSDELLSTFNMYLENNYIPNGIKDIMITVLYKKGNSKILDNYRGIAVISHIGKLLERMIFKRLSYIVEKFNWLPDSQNGFRNNRSTINSIFVSKQISKLCLENNINCYKIYVDLVKAYDKVNQEILWQVLEKRGVPNKFLNLIKNTIIGSKAKIKYEGKLSDSFFLKCGLKQGSIISPILFNIFFGAIIENVNKKVKGLGITLIFKRGGNIFNISEIKRNKKDTTEFEIWNNLFADDAEIFSDSEENLQKIIIILKEVLSAYGQEISIKKTETMVTDSKINKNVVTNITIDNDKLKNVTTFKYLGVIENIKSNVSSEIKDRIVKTNIAFNKYRVSVFNNSDLSYKIILSNYRVLILSILLYACEVWILSKAEIEELEKLQRQFLKRIFRLTDYNHKVSYLDLIMLTRKYGVEILPIEIVVRKRRLNFFGRVNRMDKETVCYKLLHSDIIEGKRTRGGQIEGNYRSTIKSDMKEFNIKNDTWNDNVQDANKWSKIVEDGVIVSFRKFCINNMSETNYQEVNISQKGKTIKSNSLKELKKLKIMLEVTSKRGRGTQSPNFIFSDFESEWHMGAHGYT